MQFNEYQQLAARTIRPDQAPEQRLTNFALGLAGEAGETVDYLKKVLFHDAPLDPVALARELGDVLWYLTALATTCELELDDIAAGNIAKLERRYPQGFSPADSQRRVDMEQI